MHAHAQLALGLDPRPMQPLTLTHLRDLLLPVHGPQRDAARLDPVTQLVLAILSARTRDEVALAALGRLARCYGSWDALADAEPGGIETILLPVTHAYPKARQLPRALRMVRARSGRLDLGFLADLPVALALRWLMALPGVGMRNAATVLNFSTLRGRAFSIDTHVLRIGCRLGLFPPGADIERAYAIAMDQVPDAWTADDLYELHWLMKLHGQSTCTFDGPACAACVLKGFCYPSPARPRPASSPGCADVTA